MWPSRDGCEVSRARVTTLINHFLCDPDTAEFGPYGVIEGEPLSAEELLPGRLYLLRMVNRDEMTVDVQVFLGIADLGGLMWEQDVRALLRMGGSGHPALPEVLDGGYRSSAETTKADPEAPGMAFVVTRGSSRRTGPHTIDYFRTRPREAFRQFRSLAEGLATLHQIGIAHRNISPVAIDEYPGPQLRLARFELSALVSDLFRATVDSGSDTHQLKELFLQQNATALAYSPPERLAFVLSDDTTSELVENDRSDVYGLAAVVWEWLLGPFPADRLPVLPATGILPADPAPVRDSFIRFNRFLRDSLREATEVPADLAHILIRMLDTDPDERPAPEDVIGLLSGSYERIMASWEDTAADEPHVLVFMPVQSAETVYRWGWVENHPTSSEGRLELVDMLIDDLRGGSLTSSPHGADPYVRGGDPEAKRAARFVLRGQQATWFCDYFRPRDEYGALDPPTDNALVIKYVAQNSLPWVDKGLRELDWSQSRRIPEVTPLAMDIDPTVFRRRMSRRPSWRPLLESTAVEDGRSPQDLAYQRAIDWLIDYQDVELNARNYPYVLVETGLQGDALLRYDEERDRRRIMSSPLFVKYAADPDLRPEFGEFFGRLENDDGGSEVDLFADGPGGGSSRAEVVGSTGQDRILLRRKAGAPDIPAVGWIRAKDDRGSRAALDRQRDARYELYRSRLLLEQIRNPHTIRTFEHHWQDAGRELKGDGRLAVREMLVCEPFAAIQGPPGTGKTRVAAAAIAASLRRDPSARILVSAQSNYALDNLAARVLAEIGATDPEGRPVTTPDSHLRPIALRVTSRSLDAEDRVDRRVAPWTRNALAETQVGLLRRYAQGLLSDRNARLAPGLPAVLEDWVGALSASGESVIPELSDRLHRGANLVFATCATSTPGLLSPTGTAVYDWVVIEEAAKAWPTELAIPLVRGLRWTLIGDHFQLPAHRRRDVERFLDSCIADPHEGMALLGAERDSYLDAFDLFGHLFATRTRKGRRAAPPPLLRMSTQFRMREPIGELVSRVFYPAEPQPEVAPPDGLPAGGLATYLDVDPAKRIPPIRLTSPPELDGESVVWIDTAGIASCRDRPHWSNPGEAAVVLKLLDRLNPFPRRNRDGYSDSPLAVLTPYRAQKQLLSRSSLAREHLSTVHAFQGREADMVIVSLVRDRAPAGYSGTSAAAIAGLGHLAQRELVNVLFSRARRQLVVVGRFDHYARISGRDGFWTKVCRAVEQYGTVVSARELFGDIPTLERPADLDEWDDDGGSAL